jgi:predicted MPP superfamily phosphohydrolase
MDSIKWLHLSDFHTGKDEYGQIKLFDSIIEHIQENIGRDNIPDFIVITGDIANKSKESEYEIFCEDFLFPLRDTIGKNIRIYIVPGNHDVNRDEVKVASLYGISKRVPKFFDTDKAGFKDRSDIFPRFENYIEYIASELFTDFNSGSIFSEEGSFADTYNKYGRKVGILGLNTAWLSMGDKDKEELTPGKSIVQEGLEKIKDCDYKIVLGHHPLEWFNEEKQPIRSLLAKNNVVYLHGHLHKNDGEQIIKGNKGYVTVQAGAAFQAREDEQWINCLLWCELDLKHGQLYFMPRKWSRDQQEWSLDAPEGMPESYRLEGTDKWIIPIRLQDRDKDMNSLIGNDKAQIDTPMGWTLLNREFFSKKAQIELDDDAILAFFNGKAPTWREAISTKIPQRNIVETIISDLNNAARSGQTKAILISGAGGEGKTTVLLQCIHRLIELEKSWNVLYINNPDKGMEWPNLFLDKTLRGNGPWLIACDDVDLIAKNIFKFIKMMNSQGRKDIHFLMCCRDTDWIAAEAKEWPWSLYSDFKEYRLRGINRKDAIQIIKGWSQLGAKGLGKLENMDFDEAVNKLLLTSKSEEEKYEHEGAFLGAMLNVRLGDDLKTHINAMLCRLKERQAFDGTLLDAFSYIAAMHAEELSILSKEVLIEMYNCKPKDIKRIITGPLGDEAASSVGGDFVFTRHISVAKAAVEILSNNYNVDFDEVYIDLARAAVNAWAKGEYIPQLGKWRYLSEHFLEKGKEQLAIKIDKELLKIDKLNPYLIVHLSKLYRKVQQIDLSLVLFRNLAYEIFDRALIYEWSVVEGNNKNYALNVYLGAISVSDNIVQKPIDNHSAKIGLSGISVAFMELYKLYNQRIYIEACAASAQIGMNLVLDSTTKHHFGRNLAISKEYDVSDMSLKYAFEIFKKGVNLAYKQREYNLQNWLEPSEDLDYKWLAFLVKIDI